MIDLENFDKELIEDICDALNITVDDIESFDKGSLVLTDGREYSVFESYDDAYNAAVKLAKDLLMMDCVDYTHLKQFIDIKSCIDQDWFDEALREISESYVNDIAEEYVDDDMTRLQQEMEECGCSDEDEYIEYLIEQAGDPIEWYIGSFGENDFMIAVTENNLIDFDKTAELCVECDGMGNYIASYDGDEIEYNGIYLYREN